MNKKKLYQAGLVFFPANDEREEQELAGLLKKFVSNPNARFLDVGIGTGRFVSKVHRAFAGFSCYGIDVVPDFARQKIEGVQVSLQSAENLSFEDDFFDVLACIDALHHVPNREKALSEMSRVLKKGGVVIFRDIRLRHALDKLLYRLIDLSCFAYNSNMPKYFRAKEWEQKLFENGLKLLHIKKFDSQLDWMVCQKEAKKP